MSFPFREFESKWQKKWQEARIFETKFDLSLPKYYILDMFPYPSGTGLHVGHVEGYTASDIMARYKRARRFNVLHPMGWDAFGLPAEQHAIQTGIHPEVTTKKAIGNFIKQLKMLGFSYDWSREISTCDPKYYKWTQYVFTLLYKKGLAYQKDMPVNWCPALKTVLANEEVVDGKSERGGHPVEQRLMKQWMLKITAYAERLLNDLDKIDWHERTKEGQRNWIGRSEGINILYDVEGHKTKVEVFTTRPDTNFGATFVVAAPDSPLVIDNLALFPNKADVSRYCAQAKKKTEIERIAEGKKKTGVFTGLYALNKLNNKKLPIYVGDFVLGHVGTGVVVGVPGHDVRDFEFAQVMDIEIVRVVVGPDGDISPIVRVEQVQEEAGTMVHSDFLDGMDIHEAKTVIMDHLEKKGWGRRVVNYKLRDWLFSRQRFWGEPFPIVHLEKSGTKVLDLKDLPVILPQVKDYEPTASGEAPLAKAPVEWLNVKIAGESGRRETDTMPGSAGSSWYFLRFTDPHNDQAICSKEAEKYFMPVDLYLGGAEHTVGHLMYARFWQKVLYDEGLVTHEEPFKKLVHQGMILGEDGEKMSKSRGNTVNPDDVVASFGADALRVYEMFMGPLERDKPWSQNGLVGVFKFLAKVWRLVHDEREEKIIIDDSEPSEEVLHLTHKTIKKVQYDIENLAFNTAVSQMMIFVNEVSRTNSRPRLIIKPFIQCLAPFAPHIAEEIWHKMGESGFVSVAPWPKYDEALAKSGKVTIAVQVNGKTRAKLEFDQDVEEADVLAEAKKVHFISNELASGKAIQKVIFVKNRIMNVII